MCRDKVELAGVGGRWLKLPKVELKGDIRRKAPPLLLFLSDWCWVEQLLALDSQGFCNGLNRVETWIRPKIRILKFRQCSLADADFQREAIKRQALRRSQFAQSL